MDIDLLQVKRLVKNQNLEYKFNGSFNKFGINDPKRSFMSIKEIKEFLSLGDEVNYQNYYAYLCASVDFENKLALLIDYWASKDLKVSYKKEQAKIYLFKKFVIDPVDGIQLELEALNEIKLVFPDFEITESTYQEDIEQCFDYKLKYGKYFFSFQVKPYSFFGGLKSKVKNTYNSLVKIIKANKKFGNNIFILTKLSNGKFAVSVVKENHVYFTSLENFRKQNTIINFPDYAHNSLNALLKIATD